MIRRVSIVTPIHDEEANLAELCNRIASTMEAWRSERAGTDWELLACDDASSDESLEVLRAIAKREPRVRPLSNLRRSGQTGGFVTGFAAASGDVVVTMDADLQVFPEDIPALLAPLERDERDLTNAVRVGRQHGAASIAISRLGNAALRLLLRVPVADAGSNFTAVRARFVRGLRLVENDHRYLVPILVRRGLDPARVADVPVRHAARRRGASKYRALEKAIGGAPELLRVRRRIASGFYDEPTE